MTSSASSLRLLAALAATTPLVWAVPSARADDNEIPALNATDTGTHLAGKIVWADLFTSDAPAAAKFYERMFGWTAALVYHLCNGLRHLAWDAGFGFDKGAYKTTGIVVLAATAVGTILIWLVVLLGGAG